ncbi:MAG: DUF1592 domain-containing protein, partial [Gemmatimonadota bacterium]|nr:DUF1592 domain-containing protein [Gemmatimonadota bacterium]
MLKPGVFLTAGVALGVLGILGTEAEQDPGVGSIPDMAARSVPSGARSLFGPHGGWAARAGHEGSASAAGARALGSDDNEVIEQYCVRCHNERRLRGNMSLEGFDASDAPADAELAERMIRKLRAGMMPPSGSRRPEEQVLVELTESLERQLDDHAVAAPNPGRRSFQRLNRAEYQASIADLLDLEIQAGDYLPLDTKSAGFDNIADAQILSATLMDGYFRAASEISRLAVGDPQVTSAETTYRVSRRASQTEHVPGAPYGTRGGVAVRHTFPADGNYSFRVSFHHETTGELFGDGRNALSTDEESPELLEISIDGEAVLVLEVPRWMHTSDPDGVNLRAGPVFVRAGPRQVAAAFIKKVEGPLQDLISPHDWSIASTSIAGAYGFTSLPHLRDLAIRGPDAPVGVTDTPMRRAIFTCRPSETLAAEDCAAEIVARLARRAYRRPLSEADTAGLMSLYRTGAAESGFEEGIRLALEGMLASPHFVFRLEEPGAPAGEGDALRITPVDLASRLSFFLWGTGPDEELLASAEAGRLTEPQVLRTQVDRMLRDPRGQALATRFGAQWLRLQDLEKVEPDPRLNPDFDEQLKSSMLRETELFLENMVRQDRPVLELLTADYTFVNERLARHYRIPDVAGNHFRRVTFPDEHRRGILGHGSVLTLTSHADRTSPVLRGKWVMEVLLGTPPPPPPPDVPELEESESASEGRFLTVRERMEMHRSNPTCNSCHRMIDPIGLALENFDITGAYRIKDQGMPVDAVGELYDGTPVTSPRDLRDALLKRPEPLLRTFTENLMAFALGRRVEYFDQPAVRRVVDN